MIAFRIAASFGCLALLLLAGCAASPVRAAAEQLLPVSVVPASNAADSALVAAIDSFTKRRAAMDSLSGVVLLARDDQPIYAYTTGLADRATGAPVGLDTPFNLGSLDKYFTRIAIRQLQQAGRLRMSDLVGRHLPDYANARVRDEVTIGHLYHMRSGLGDFDSDDYRSLTRAAPTLRGIDDYIALFIDDTLAFKPGTSTRYSNAGYVLLGKIIERASGMSYYDYVQRHIFDAAGMRGTGYFPPPNEPGSRVAIGYTRSARARGDFSDGAKPLAERHPNTSLLAWRGSSAGGGYSSARDLLALSRALRQHRLLDAAFTDSLFAYAKRTPGKFEWDGWAGGSEGINTIFYMHDTGHTLIVLSNYDDPSARIYRGKLWNEWLPAWLRASS